MPAWLASPVVRWLAVAALLVSTAAWGLWQRGERIQAQADLGAAGQQPAGRVGVAQCLSASRRQTA